MSFRKIKAEFSVPITSFPESLHPLLKEIDGPEGNGALETDELTEVFEMSIGYSWRVEAIGSF